MEEGTFMNEDTLEMHKRGQSEFSLENNNQAVQYTGNQVNAADLSSLTNFTNDVPFLLFSF